MGVGYNPKIVTDSLLFCIDGANSIRPRVGNTTLSFQNGMSDASDGYYTFDGTDDYAIFSSDDFLNQTYTGKTVTALVRLQSPYGTTPSYRPIFGTSAGSSVRTFNFYLYNNGSNYSIHFSAGNGTSPAGSFSDSLPNIEDQWIMMSVSQTTSNFSTYYLNDISYGSKAQTFYQYNSGQTQEFGKAGAVYWKGNIAHVAIYGKALTTAEIKQNFNALRGRFGI